LIKKLEEGRHKNFVTPPFFKGPYLVSVHKIAIWFFVDAEGLQKKLNGLVSVHNVQT